LSRSVFQKASIPIRSLITRSTHLYPIFSYLNNHIFGTIQKAQVFLIKGSLKKTSAGGSPITTLFIGKEESAYQFAYLAYSQIEKMLYLGKFLSSQIDPARLPNIEVIVANIERPFARKFLKQGYLLLPTVDFNLDLCQSLEDIMKRMSRRRRRDIKKLECFDYSYTISRNNEKDFDFFYWNMYLPYTKKRFGKAAHIRTCFESKALCRGNGGIVFVKKEERPVVGILFQIRGKTLYALSFGVYEGNQKFVTDLAGQAALFFLVKWGKMNGLECLNYGVSMPFLREGTFMYKKEWGMRVEERTGDSVCALKFNSLGDGSISFLQQNAFILLNQGAMKGVVFVNHRPTKIELQKIFAKHIFPKLDSLIVIAYHNEPRAGNTEAIDRTEFSTRSPNFPDALVELLPRICLLLRERGFNVEVFERTREQSHIPDEV